MPLPRVVKDWDRFTWPPPAAAGDPPRLRRRGRGGGEVGRGGGDAGHAGDSRGRRALGDPEAHVRNLKLQVEGMGPRLLEIRAQPDHSDNSINTPIR